MKGLSKGRYDETFAGEDAVPCDNEGASCQGLGTVKLVLQAEYLAHV